jgi:ectoine hydroxylase-related dioxygenase (phytanoyl-CoA dioxygenase family)
MSALSTRQTGYERDGFVREDGVALPHLTACRREADRLVEAEDLSVVWRFGSRGRKIHFKIPQLAESNATFRALARSPALVALVEELIGPAVIFRDVLIGKPPARGAVVHYHQDAAYWDVDRPEKALSAWIALDDAPKEAGCLTVYPGTQRGRAEHALFVGKTRLPDPIVAVLRRATSLTGTGDNPKTAAERAFAGAKSVVLGSATRLVPALNSLNDLQVDPRTLPPDGLVSLPAKAGDAILFASLLVHGSGPNTSPHPRRAYIISYMNADCRVPGRSASEFLPARPPN